MARGILQLPEELQFSCVEYIVRPTDLKSLCCTCKGLATNATKLLYRWVEIDTENTRLLDGKGFLISGNRGHEHVRSLTLSSRRWPEDRARDERNAKFSRVALQLLPRDKLATLKQVHRWCLSYLALTPVGFHTV